MCGIIGYVGKREAVPLLINGLKKLEYRGYDSSGVGILSGQTKRIIVCKTQGKIRNLEESVRSRPLPHARIGISHTRWATHGKPSRTNAHPHQDSGSRFAVVHNGIIENYESLRAGLKKRGVKFVSETDTEVIVQLIAACYQGDFPEAVRHAVNRLEGAFALGVVCRDQPDTLVAVRVGSPLIIGTGDGENFIASDVPAILEETRKIIYLKDREMAVIKKDSVGLFDFKGRRLRAKVDTVKFTIGSAQKEGYPHFMLKEIHEQPKVLRHMLSLRTKGRTVKLDGLSLTERQLQSFSNIVIVACGTAYHAGLVGKYLIEYLSEIPVWVDVSSEFRYRSPIIGRKTMVVAISQSGETADTLAAVREARAKGARIVSIVNAVGSSLARESDGVLYTHAGPEIGVASTKAYTAQLMMLYLLALKLGIRQESISDKKAAEILSALKGIPALYERYLSHKKVTARIARANAHFGCFLFLGRNINYPSALEGALKLKEISYIPAEGYAAGEMKHGPIALIDEYRAVVCLAPESDIYEKMISNMQEIRSRRGKIIAVATEGDATIREHAHHVIYVPSTHKLLTPLMAILPLQLLAYYIAVKCGCDVDQPRNLAKSVTVE